MEDAEYKEKILSVFADSKGRFGAKKIKVKLIELGYRVSEKRIRRLMHEMELKCNKSKPPRKYKPLKQRQYYKNWLEREFTQTESNRAWVSDITEFKIRGKKYYICVIIDLFSRKVIGHDVSSAMTAQLVEATFYAAYFERGCPKNLIFHSDQGSQYTSKTFKESLKKLNVKQSYSEPGCPYDNAVVESFFASMKKKNCIE